MNDPERQRDQLALELEHRRSERDEALAVRIRRGRAQACALARGEASSRKEAGRQLVEVYDLLQELAQSEGP